MTTSTSTATATTMDVARKLVELCSAGKNAEAVETLLAEDVVSIEAIAMPNGSREAKGRDAVRAKGKWWTDTFDTHSSKVTGPWPHDDRFVVGFNYEVTAKATGERKVIDEVGLYTVRNGKIVREEFFYST